MIPGGILGPLGGLEQLKFTTAEPWERPSRKRTTASLSGRTASQILPRAPRVWSCEIAHDAPNEGRVVDELEEYQWQNARTLTWYPADAVGVNILDPEATAMSPKRWTKIMEGGPSVLPDDPGMDRYWQSASTPPDGTWAHLSRIPVPHGITLCVGATVIPYVGQTGYFYVDEIGFDGATLKVHKQHTPDPRKRLMFKFTTSLETVALTLGFARCAAVAMPQVAFTDYLPAYGTGRGALNALVEVTGRNPLWVDAQQSIYSTAERTSFTVTEQLE